MSFDEKFLESFAARLVNEGFSLDGCNLFTRCSDEWLLIKEDEGFLQVSADEIARLALDEVKAIARAEGIDEDEEEYEVDITMGAEHLVHWAVRGPGGEFHGTDTSLKAAVRNAKRQVKAMRKLNKIARKGFNRIQG